jgi:hypothetical protein
MAKGYKTGGREAGTPNKATASIREAAQQYTETAIQTLVEVMSDETAPHAARVAAANSLLDRGHGKPRQELDVDHKGELTHLIVKFVDSDGDGNAID